MMFLKDVLNFMLALLVLAFVLLPRRGVTVAYAAPPDDDDDDYGEGGGTTISKEAADRAWKETEGEDRTGGTGGSNGSRRDDDDDDDYGRGGGPISKEAADRAWKETEGEDRTGGTGRSNRSRRDDDDDDDYGRGGGPISKEAADRAWKETEGEDRTGGTGRSNRSRRDDDDDDDYGRGGGPISKGAADRAWEETEGEDRTGGTGGSNRSRRDDDDDDDDYGRGGGPIISKEAADRAWEETEGEDRTGGTGGSNRSSRDDDYGWGGGGTTGSPIVSEEASPGTWEPTTEREVYQQYANNLYAAAEAAGISEDVIASMSDEELAAAVNFQINRDNQIALTQQIEYLEAHGVDTDELTPEQITSMVRAEIGRQQMQEANNLYAAAEAVGFSEDDIASMSDEELAAAVTSEFNRRNQITLTRQIEYLEAHGVDTDELTTEQIVARVGSEIGRQQMQDANNLYAAAEAVGFSEDDIVSMSDEELAAAVTSEFNRRNQITLTRQIEYLEARGVDTDELTPEQIGTMVGIETGRQQAAVNRNLAAEINQEPIRTEFDGETLVLDPSKPFDADTFFIVSQAANMAVDREMQDRLANYYEATTGSRYLGSTEANDAAYNSPEQVAFRRRQFAKFAAYLGGVAALPFLGPAGAIGAAGGAGLGAIGGVVLPVGDEGWFEFTPADRQRALYSGIEGAMFGAGGATGGALALKGLTKVGPQLLTKGSGLVQQVGHFGARAGAEAAGGAGFDTVAALVPDEQGRVGITRQEGLGIGIGTVMSPAGELVPAGTIARVGVETGRIVGPTEIHIPFTTKTITGPGGYVSAATPARRVPHLTAVEKSAEGAAISGQIFDDIATTGQYHGVIGETQVDFTQGRLAEALRKANPDNPLYYSATPATDAIAAGPEALSKPKLPETEQYFFVSPGEVNANFMKSSAFGGGGSGGGSIHVYSARDVKAVGSDLLRVTDEHGNVKFYKGGYEAEKGIPSGQLIPPSEAAGRAGGTLTGRLFLGTEVNAPSVRLRTEANLKALADKLFPGKRGEFTFKRANQDVIEARLDDAAARAEAKFADDVEAGTAKVDERDSYIAKAREDERAKIAAEQKLVDDAIAALDEMPRTPDEGVLRVDRGESGRVSVRRTTDPSPVESEYVFERVDRDDPSRGSIERGAAEEPGRPIVEEPGRPVVEEPGRPVVEEPGRPIVEEPGRPIVEEPGRPIVEEPGRPVVEEPARPTFEEPGRPTFEEPDRPVFEEPGRPIVEEPTTERPPGERPTTERPLVEEPATERPPVEPPTTMRPPVERPTTERPPVEPPTTAPPPLRRIKWKDDNAIEETAPTGPQIYPRITRHYEVREVLHDLDTQETTSNLLRTSNLSVAGVDSTPPTETFREVGHKLVRPQRKKVRAENVQSKTSGKGKQTPRISRRVNL